MDCPIHRETERERLEDSERTTPMSGSAIDESLMPGLQRDGGKERYQEGETSRETRGGEKTHFTV